MRRRLVARAALCLVIGAVVSLGVAVGVSFLSIQRTHGVGWAQGSGPDRWLVRMEQHWGISRIDAARVRETDTVQDLPNTGNYIVNFRAPGVLIVFDSRNPHPQSGSPPRYANLASRPDDVRFVSSLATGWPLRCLRAEATGPVAAFGNGSQAGVRGALRFRAARIAPAGGLLPGGGAAAGGIDSVLDGVIPLRPIWTGLVLNALVYGLCLMLLSMLVAGLLRTIRVRAGHCPRCGYDLVGALSQGCPECGWNRPETGAGRIQN